MDLKHKTGEVVAYLLATVTGTLLLPVVVPVIMSMNTLGYTNKYLWMPGIQFKNAFVSDLTAFAYVVVFAIPIHGIAFFSGGGTVLDSSPAGVDGDELVAGLIPELNLSKVPTFSPVEEENKDIDLNNETQDHE